jgi:uracil-DNA glycosylase family 4
MADTLQWRLPDPAHGLKIAAMTDLSPDPSSARQILEFLLAAGVDIPLGDEPVNRLAPPPAPAVPVADAAPVVSAPAAPKLAGPEEAAAEARALAKEAPHLEALRAALDAFEGCALKKTASRLVFADGVPGARVMIIGEAPGREEDETGRPFVGRAGQLLDKMLATIKLDRTSVYIANVVPWRPPGNRTPTPQEIAICLPFILRQIALAKPDILVTMGAPSSQTLLNAKEGILRLRGRWFDFSVGEKNAAGARKIPALAMLHPAYLLRSPGQKNLAWRDLRALKARLETLSAKEN